MTPPPPPLAVPVSSRGRKGFQALAANEAKMQAIRKNAETSAYVDGPSPSTRCWEEVSTSAPDCWALIGGRRVSAIPVYRLFGVIFSLSLTINSYFEHHFLHQRSRARAQSVSRTKQSLEGITNIWIGKFEDKVKTATLWGFKHALYWWASVLVPNLHLHLMWQKWHEEVSRHIHQLAVQESLSARS
ncbi:hypothetical protein K504DRAFT_453892 [Pleomassaria siparia CBS 279.74]|uniref:Uncharacterized protein n=1 Tax=Pleomassaria siparia CBS 279.74 TaxID=1314801 RepID=A0A6G1KE76_9PLEO|nr:hypothetical protein K504DRAFT_453892 [Pleomassaria siparia CBS 279.74]